MPLALLALAIGAFGIGTTEFVIMGLLPEVAGDYGVSIPTAGFLVTGYALGVVLGAPLMTVLGTRIPRKRMLMLGGRYADRALMPLLYVSLGALALTLAVFTLTAHTKAGAAVTIVLIGALGFATVPPLQKRVLDQAAGAPTLASAVNIGAFNLGNALAAWLGGLVIAAGLGWTAPNWVGAALAASALVLALVSGALERRTSAARPGAGAAETDRSVDPGTAVPVPAHH